MKTATRNQNAEGAILMKTMELVVECQTGFLGESIPRRFFIGTKPFEVVEVLDHRWKRLLVLVKLLLTTAVSTS
ncbi:MAG: hypothetical protein R3B54_10505 [Bdellovibrionota bacterium]